MTRKIFNYILTILFILLISLPISTFFFNFAPIIKLNEKRVLASQPQFSFKNYKFFPEKFDAFFNDTFGFRNFLIYCYNYIKINWTKASKVSKVVIGKDQWLFMAGDDAINDYRCTKPFSEKELENIADTLTERNEWLKNIGIKFLIVVVPNKHSIYPEKLPFNIKKVRDESRFDQIKKYLQANTDINFLDLTPALKKGKNSPYPVYIKNDTHWTEYGALIANKEIIDELKKDFPSLRNCRLEDYTFRQKKWRGDLACMANLDSFDKWKGDMIYVKPRTAFKCINGSYDFTVPKIFNKTICRKMFDKRLPKMLAFRDSFGISLERVLSEYFFKSTYIWCYDFLPKPIESEMPDVVIFEIAERLLNHIAHENPKQVKDGYYTIGTNELSKNGNYKSIIFDSFDSDKNDWNLKKSYINDDVLVLDESLDNTSIATTTTDKILPNRQYRISFSAKKESENSSGRLFLDLFVNVIYDNPEQELCVPCSELSTEWQTFSKVINSSESPDSLSIRIVAQNAAPIEIDWIKIEIEQ